jgi:SAM-dependent methyltransferase
VDAGDVEWLRSDEGRAASDEAASLLAELGELPAQRRLGKRYSRARARALVTLEAGRRSAAGKFADAGVLFCDRASAEQASGDIVAAHTARRFGGFDRIADLGCGIGGDTLALARHAQVEAVDHDRTRLAMLIANAAVRGAADRVDVSEGEIEQWKPDPAVQALWIDPGRRDDRGRRFDPEQWSPPLSTALRLATSVPAAGIKLAPGIDVDAIPAEGELEFISVNGRLVEAVLWLGSLVTESRRATVLPAGASLAGEPDGGVTEMAEPGHFFYDPDPGVGRASLIDVLATQLDARKLDERVAYLTAAERQATPFARRFRVLAWLPHSERRLYDQLRAMGAGRVEVMRRASPIDTNALERRLNEALGGSGDVMTVALTRLRGRQVSLVLERERD